MIAAAVGAVALGATIVVVQKWNARRHLEDKGFASGGSIQATDQSEGPPPRLAVQVMPAQPKEQPRNPVRVSNLQNVKLEVSLAGSILPLAQLNTAAMINSAQTLEISVREVPSKRAVPIRVWQTGGGSSGGTQTARLDVEISVDAAVARRRIDEALQASEKEEEQRIAAGKGNPRALEQLRRQHDKAVSLLQREYFHENRTGVFEVQALYRSSAEGFWKGMVTSERVAFEVVYEGDYLQKHHMR